MNPLLSAILEDSFTGTKTSISLTDTTFYDFTVDQTAGSYSPDRFRIVFKVFSGGPLQVTFTSVTAYRQGKDITVKWILQNELGIAAYEVEKSTDGINFTAVSRLVTSANSNSGYAWLDKNVDAAVAFYRIRSIDIAGKKGYSKIVKVNSSLIPVSLMVYPNPISGDNVDLRFSNMPAGNYTIRFFNNIGQLLFSNSLTHVISTVVQTISLPTSFKTGVYQLEIIHPDKSTTILKVIK